MSHIISTTIEISVDANWYLATYVDARQAIKAGVYKDALDHYLKMGMRDGRVPLEPEVDEAWYLKRYPDVAEAIRSGRVKSAKLHYARWGHREGRFPTGDDLAAHFEPSQEQSPLRRLLFGSK
jgi:hypothetical protein